MSVVAPTSDVTVTGWTPSTGATVYGVIDDAPGVPDDTDYAYADAPTSPSMIEGLAATVPAGPHKVRVRTNVSSGAYQIRVSLLDGSNVEQGSSGLTDIDGTITTYTIAVPTVADTSRVKVEVVVGDMPAREVVTTFLDVVSGHLDG